MTQAHINSILPIKNRVLGVDEDTVFLAHYDLNEHDVLRNIESIGESKAAAFDTTYFKSQGQQYTISNKITLAAWVYPTAAPTGDRAAIVIGKPAGGYYFTLDTSFRLSAYWHGKNPAGYHNSVGTCPLNQWTHVAMVWGSTELKLYINGILDSTIATTGTGTAPTAIDIASENGTNRHFKGRVHSLGIWAQEKSIEDIKTIMNKGISGSESGLRAFWKMNQGEGTVLQDASPFNQDIVSEPNKTFSWSSGNSVFTLRPKEGYFGGGAIAVEEATTNIPTSGVAGMNGITYTHVGEEDGYKKYSIAGTWNAGTYPYSLHLGSVSYTAGLSYSISCCLYTNVPQKFLGSGTYGLFGVINVVNDGAMTGAVRAIRHGNYTAREDFIHSVNMGNQAYVISQPISDGTVFDPLTDFMYIKDIQVEQKSFATSFVNGARPAGKLTYPNPIYGSNEGTINFWAKFPNTSSVLTSQVWFWDYDGTNVTEWFGIANSGGVYKLANFGNKDASLYQDTWHMYTIVKDETDALRTYIDGVMVETKTGPSVSTMFKSSDRFNIGSHSNGAYPANIIMDELRIDKIARTDEEIMAWYQSNSPFWPRGIYRQSY